MVKSSGLPNSLSVETILKLAELLANKKALADLADDIKLFEAAYKKNNEALEANLAAEKKAADALADLELKKQDLAGKEAELMAKKASLEQLEADLNMKEKQSLLKLEQEKAEFLLQKGELDGKLQEAKEAKLAADKSNLEACALKAEYEEKLSKLKGLVG